MYLSHSLITYHDYGQMFLLGVKIEIEIIEVKHQKFFLIVW